MNPPSRFLIVLCTYNERENLPSLLSEIRRFAPSAHTGVPDGWPARAADILIIDDNSPDGTGELAEEIARRMPGVFVIHREGKLGLGSGLIRGLGFAAERGYDFALTMDADFSHHPKYLPAILQLAPQCDVVIGSRYIPGGGSLNWPLWRRLISRTVNFFCRIILRIPVHDASGGFRCYRLAGLARIDLDRVFSKGYTFQEEMLLRLHRASHPEDAQHPKGAGLKFAEVPIVFENRARGKSKANLPEIIKGAFHLIRLSVRR
jgi:dolichol-phosphate mannosyltransferase